MECGEGTEHTVRSTGNYRPYRSLAPVDTGNGESMGNAVSLGAEAPARISLEREEGTDDACKLTHDKELQRTSLTDFQQGPARASYNNEALFILIRLFILMMF